MKLRMTLATGMAVAALVTLSGCDRGGDDATPTASPSTSDSATPSATEPSDKADLVGKWEDTEAQWVVHFNADGTFVEDFQGIVDFRVGTYEVNGETVSLIGDDGNTTTGQIVGVTLAFKLGTLIRS
jgi:hypothetical protein